MLLALAGVTGVGKSYYKDVITEELNFEKVKIITTRPMREGEKNNEDKIFVTPNELQILRNKKQIAYEFELVGNIYAYSKEEIFSDRNTVFELHYDTIVDFKEICPKMRSIYLMPKDIEIAKEKTRQRHLKLQEEQKRILELEEHYERIMKDEKLRNMFDYILYNNYDDESKKAIINLVSKILEKD